MPRTMRGMRLRPVKSYKHIVDTSGLVTNVVSISDVIVGADNPTLANVAQVETASTVSAIFLNVQVYRVAVSSGVARFYFIVWKNPGGALITPNPSATGSDADKRHIIHQEMIVLNNSPPVDGQTFPRTMFKGVIRIPRNLKRFGINDKLSVAFITPDSTGTANFCLQCIYKEFR